MSGGGRDRQYERLYTQLLTRAEQLHQSNKKRIHRGMIGLIVLPVVLCIILWLTGSDKIVFLIIWVIFMFILSAYLIAIEYMDDFVQKTLKEMSDSEAEFDDLLSRPEPIQDRLADRLSDLRSLRAARRARREGAGDDPVIAASAEQQPGASAEAAPDEAAAEHTDIAAGGTGAETAAPEDAGADRATAEPVPEDTEVGDETGDIDVTDDMTEKVTEE